MTEQFEQMTEQFNYICLAVVSDVSRTVSLSFVASCRDWSCDTLSWGRGGCAAIVAQLWRVLVVPRLEVFALVIVVLENKIEMANS